MLSKGMSDARKASSFSASIVQSRLLTSMFSCRVLLGSFSNYLVTKSSVPVMVARKKLQKPNSKSRLPHVRLANNLTPAKTTKSLADAKID